MKNKNLLVLCESAVFCALFVVFSYFFTVEIGNTLKISWTSLPLLIAALVLPRYASLSVALCGSFLGQLKYGLMPSTVLWMLPFILQAFFCCAFKRRCKSGAKLIILIVLSEILLTVANTVSMVLAGYLEGTLPAIIATAPLKLLNCGIRATISAIAVPIIAERLKKINNF